MTVSRTANFRFGIPDFNADPWHQDFDRMVRDIDNAIAEAVFLQGLSFWDNSTDYVVGQIVQDQLTGIIYTCGVNHTSTVTPETFEQDRVNHPTYWNPVATVPEQKGQWTTNTIYHVGDFAVESDRYAVCRVAHLSTDFDTDLGDGLWTILIDLSSRGVGMNVTPEGTIAATTTTDIGNQDATRLFVTGTGFVIGSYGIIANQYKLLRFEGSGTITHEAVGATGQITIPGGSDRTVAAGDQQLVTSDSTGKWREILFTRADGSPLGVSNASTSTNGITTYATETECVDGLINTKAVTPLGLAAAASVIIDFVFASLRGSVGPTMDTMEEISNAVNLLAPKASPTFTGTPVAPTATVGDSTTKIATTAFVTRTAQMTVQDLTAGSGATYTTPAGAKQLRIRMVGGGGGGAGSGTVASGNNGSAGGNSIFNSIEAAGGSGGDKNATSVGGSGGNSGTGGTGTATLRIPGGRGGAGADGGTVGGFGGDTMIGPTIGGRPGGTGGPAAPNNTGSGGAGGGGGSTFGAGGGGGGGEYVELIINNPGANYTYTIGTGGAGGVAGTSGNAGGAGGTGRIIVEEIY